MIKYAKTDNLFFCAENGRGVFKHIFLPNPRMGKNSSVKLKGRNGILLPRRKYTLFDKTKQSYYDGKDEI